MLKITVELSDTEIRKILARHIQDTYDQRCKAEDIRFLVELGYSGEMGGEPTPSHVELIWEAEGNISERGGR